MKTLAHLYLAVLLTAGTAIAADTRPSPQSIHELLEVTGAPQIMNTMTSQMDGYMNNIMRQASQGKTITPERQQAMDDARKRIITLFQEELDWTKLEPVYIKAYTDNLTQSEVDALLKFYRTPAGSSVVKKLPLISQSAMAAMQDRMVEVVKRAQQMAPDSAAQNKQP